MALDNAKKFIEDLQNDEKLKASFADITAPEDIVRIASSAGYDFDEEELQAAEKECRQALAVKADEAMKELSSSELDGIAGGGWFGVETAPDGHDMGCLVTYHGEDWSNENDTWCDDAYFCNRQRYGKRAFHYYEP